MSSLLLLMATLMTVSAYPVAGDDQQVKPDGKQRFISDWRYALHEPKKGDHLFIISVSVNSEKITVHTEENAFLAHQLQGNETARLSVQPGLRAAYKAATDKLDQMDRDELASGVMLEVPNATPVVVLRRIEKDLSGGVPLRGYEVRATDGKFKGRRRYTLDVGKAVKVPPVGTVGILRPDDGGNKVMVFVSPGAYEELNRNGQTDEDRKTIRKNLVEEGKLVLVNLGTKATFVSILDNPVDYDATLSSAKPPLIEIKSDDKRLVDKKMYTTFSCFRASSTQK